MTLHSMRISAYKEMHSVIKQKPECKCLETQTFTKVFMNLPYKYKHKSFVQDVITYALYLFL